jgi:hypothetical protein
MLTAAQSVTGKPRFTNGKGDRKAAPSAGKEIDERATRKKIAAGRRPVNYGKVGKKRLVQGQSDEAKLSNRLYRLPEALPKQVKKLGISRA